MQYNIIINSFSIVNEIEGVWSNKDYIELLEKFDYPDPQNINEAELRDYLFLAISDFEPDEAAAILLKHKLSNKLTISQIESLSHEMMDDKVSEEYADIRLHSTLFNINQLLYKAYNGTFPNSKATIIEFEMNLKKGMVEVEITKEIVLKAFAQGLSDRAIINRLFSEQLKSESNFKDAEGIIWNLVSTSNKTYKITTSEYWLEKADFNMTEFTANIIIPSEENK